MTKLDKKRIELELIQVGSAKATQEFRIEELLEEIERVKVQINLQEEKEKELKNKLQLM